MECSIPNSTNPRRLLSLDLSSSTGWALFVDGKYEKSGLIEVEIEDFNVNKHPELSPLYPHNLIRASTTLADRLSKLLSELQPDVAVIENTVRGKNRSTQRCLEWIHLKVIELLNQKKLPFSYMDPSQWRAQLEIRMNNADKKKNRHVSEGKARGRITRKHLSVRYVNDTFGLNFKLKDNDIADAICLGLARLKINSVNSAEAA